MEFEKVLQIALIPSISLILLSLLSIVLTTHYWILADYTIPRWMALPSEFPEQNRFPIDDTIVYYTDATVQATIISGCLNLAAGVMAVWSWRKLRSRDLETEYHAPLRRFYLAAVFITGVSGACAAIASIATHYTGKGDDKFECAKTTGKTVSLGQPFTNYYCTREMGMCNIVKPIWKNTSLEAWGNTACNETIVVKWLQIILVVNAVIIMGMFALQAKQRKTTRGRPRNVK